MEKKRKTKHRATQFDIDLGAVLKKVRTERGVSMEKLGTELGVTFQQIQKYETGKNRMTVRTLCEISDFFGLPYNYFLPRQNQDRLTLTINDAISDLADIRKVLKTIGKLAADTVKVKHVF